MALEVYRRKRNFRATPEPAGRVSRRRSRGLAYVIQKHAASHLHYDFRLELNGVLLSWAVPKGPSLDPHDRRLAMHVEDHPLEYGDFEGIIPPKQYGSGTVLLWDRGVWTPVGDPDEGYRKGKLKFVLDGEKLHGGWILVKSHGGKYARQENAWFLIKEDDEYAQPAEEGTVVEAHPDSVKSGRSLEEIAQDRDRVWRSDTSVMENVRSGAVAKRGKRAAVDAAKVKGARKAALPELVEPELATLVDAAPSAEGWLHEVKLDGYRILARVDDGEVTLYSRNGKDWTDRFATVARALARLPVQSAWLDGEVVVLRADGRSSFQALQEALGGNRRAVLHYYVFDAPYLDGYDLRRAALADRKRTLQQVLEGASDALRYSAHVDGAGASYYDEACRLGLEGIVSKRADAPYRAGRGRDWVKVKCQLRQEMVIGGYTDPEGTRKGFGALLIGAYDDGKLRYAGKVGTGFDDETLKTVKAKLDRLAQREPPFVDPPRGAEARRAHWVRPELVAEVRFTEWTRDGTLRHPSFQGLREDKQAQEVVRERPAGEVEAKAVQQPPSRKRVAKKSASSGESASSAAEPAIAGIRLTHADKVLYPEAGITKLELARYYETVCGHILPHLKDRPLTLVRCPNGWDRKCFYQKNARDGTDPAIPRVTVETSEGPGQYMMANSLAAMIALVQMGVLEMHPWGSTRRKLGCPDRMIFDFDPDEGLGWTEIVSAAQLVRTLLEEIGLRGFLKTTGGKGLHVVVPLEAALPWDDVKGFSRAVAELLVRTFPDRYTDKVSKSRRQGRIFIDWLRNSEGATAIAAYGVRARANAPVATPIGWDELAADVRNAHFNVRNVPERLERLRGDPWADFFRAKQKITAAMMSRVGYRRAR